MSDIRSAATSPPRENRQRVLQPVLAELSRAVAAARSQGENPVSLSISELDLTVDAWTFRMLRRGTQPEQAAGSGAVRVITQSVALLIKCDGDLARPAPAAAGDLRSQQEDLVLDAAVGATLVRDVQKSIDDLLKSGSFEQAQHLSRFHHRLRNTVYEVRKRIDDAHRALVDELAEQIAGPVQDGPLPQAPRRSATRPRPAARAAAAARPGPRRRAAEPGGEPAESRDSPARGAAVERRGQDAPPTASARTSRSPAGTIGLCVLLLVTLLAWGLVSGPGPDPAPVRVSMSPSAWDTTGAVLGVVERWPSLFVEVDETAWEALDPSERDRLVQTLATRIAPDGYAGAVLRTESGRPVAQWMRTGGARLLSTRAATPRATGVTRTGS